MSEVTESTETTGKEVALFIDAEKINAATLFAGEGVEELLSHIEKLAREHVPDLSTAKGRKEVASVAYKVARSKSVLDNIGKDHVADLKAKAKSVDANRKLIRERLDALRDEVRKPLDDYDAEQERMKQELLLQQEIEKCHEQALIDNRMFDQEREIERQKAQLEKLEAERQERERAEQEAAERAEREERIRQEAAEAERQKTLQREARARVEAEQAKQAAQEAEEAAKRAQEEAAERAAQAARDAEESTRREIEEQQRRDAEEAQKRAADQQHRATINNAAVSALMSKAGLSESNAKAAVVAIARGWVPSVTIAY